MTGCISVYDTDQVPVCQLLNIKFISVEGGSRPGICEALLTCCSFENQGPVVQN